VIAPYLRREVAQKLTIAQRRALEREAVGWDELSDEDFARLFDEGQPVRVRVRRPPPRTLTIALDEQTLNRLRRIARRKQVRARHLVAIWIAERLPERLPKIIDSSHFFASDRSLRASGFGQKRITAVQ
jgi:hypothetical protein